MRLRTDLRTLQQRLGITTIYVTHDQEEALSLSDRIAVMFDGRVHQVGTPEEIYGHPTHRKVAEFVGESNYLPGVVRGVDGGVASVEVAGGLAHEVLGDCVEVLNQGVHVSNHLL